jgi:DNA-binding response OmpR family regulator
MKLNPIPAPALRDLTIPTAPKRVLVVDDDADMLFLYALTLARAGYSVGTAADGQEGWEAIHTTEYDLLVTDSDMPRLTGVALVARLRRAGITLPVIIASGSIALPEEGGDGQLGLAGVLHKPFTPDKLLSTVRQVVPLQQAAPVSAHHLEVPGSELMSVNSRRFAGLNE